MRRRSIAMVLMTVILTVLGAVPRVSAQDAAGTYQVQIRSGSCAAPGDGLAQLDELRFSSSAPVGASGAAVAASSYSIVPVALDTLTGSAAALFVFDAGSHAVVACGEIGGIIGSDGALSIGLRPVGDSGFSGIAYLSSDAVNPAQTGISTFLAATGGGAAGGSSAAMASDAYSTMVNNQLTILVGSLQRVDALFGDPHPEDRSWTSQLSGELFLWKLIYRVAREVNPPASFADFDQQYLGALELLDSAAGDIMQALKTNDKSLLDSASTEIQQAVAMLRELGSAQNAATPTP